MSTISEKKLKEIVKFLSNYGKTKTLKAYQISEETFNRYMRKARQKDLLLKHGDIKVLDQVRKMFTDEELKAIVRSGKISPLIDDYPEVHFDGKRIKFCLSGDWHLGSKFTISRNIYKMYKVCKQESVEFLTIGGDVTEGMSNRAGHIYELSHIGYDRQKDFAMGIISEAPCHVYAIDGNHDRWYLKSSGAKIVKDIADNVKNMSFLGHDVGHISLKGKAKLQLWHGEDGNTYALSYRLQKVIESLTGGFKPDIMSFSHTHKFCYIFDRHIHSISCGSLQAQTDWMRGKRIAAHTGFVIVDACINDQGVSSCSVQWYPFYI